MATAADNKTTLIGSISPSPWTKDGGTCVRKAPIGIRQRREENGVDGAENRRVGAHPERER
jgi:hypothetical protein